MLLLAKTLDPLNFPFFLLLSALVLLTCKTKFMFFFCLVNWHARCHETLFFEAVACWQVWSSFTLWSILITDIKGALTLDVLVEYLALWDLLSEASLQSDEEDTHVWQFSASGQYTSKSAYEALFIGATSFGPWERIWKNWAPASASSFCGLLHSIGAGQPIAWLEKAFPTQLLVLFVTRFKKLLITCWSCAFSPGRSGSESCNISIFRF